MKLKADFVTNSSSASFIMTLEAYDNISLKEFKEIMNDVINDFENEYRDYGFEKPHLHFWDGSHISKVSPKIFALQDWTSMYNDPADIPRYMRYMMIRSFLTDGGLKDFKIKNFKIEHDRT